MATGIVGFKKPFRPSGCASVLQESGEDGGFMSTAW